MKYSFVLLGALFGFLLSRAGATDFSMTASLFLFSNLQLLWVIVFAIGTASIGIALLKRSKIRSLIGRAELDFRGKPYAKGMLLGALIFGIGWGLAGTCPGTAPTMLGEGKLISLFTIAGIIAGTYLYGLWQSRKSVKDRA